MGGDLSTLSGQVGLFEFRENPTTGDPEYRKSGADTWSPFIKGPFDIEAMKVGDGTNITEYTVGANLTHASRTFVTYYTPYFKYNDYWSITFGSGCFARNYGCAYNCYLQKDDGTETQLLSGINAYSVICPFNFEDHESQYRLRLYFHGYYYNGSSSTLNVMVPIAVKTRATSS